MACQAQSRGRGNRPPLCKWDLPCLLLMMPHSPHQLLCGPSPPKQQVQGFQKAKQVPSACVPATHLPLKVGVVLAALAPVAALEVHHERRDVGHLGRLGEPHAARRLPPARHRVHLDERRAKLFGESSCLLCDGVSEGVLWAARQEQRIGRGCARHCVTHHALPSAAVHMRRQSKHSRSITLLFLRRRCALCGTPPLFLALLLPLLLLVALPGAPRGS